MTFVSLKDEIIFISRLNSNFVSEKTINNQKAFMISKKLPTNWIKLTKDNDLQAQTIVISEDWDFYNHCGVDINQIKATIVDYFVWNKKLRGASTITQQLVKNLFLTNQRSFRRKIMELILALYLEKMVSKKKILETYLNIIEYGNNLYGIGKSSKYYFNKSFNELSVKEVAFMAMLLPNPKRYSESFRLKKLTPYADKTINQIIEKLVTARIISPEQAFVESLQQLNFTEIL